MSTLREQGRKPAKLTDISSCILIHVTYILNQIRSSFSSRLKSRHKDERGDIKYTK